MAIQFRCSGCGQAIEVDDEYANRTVTCPFCRGAVKAPDSSEEDAAAAGAEAGASPAPSSLPTETPIAHAGSIVPAPGSAQAAKLCTLGLCCGLGVIGVSVVWGFLVMVQSGALAEMQKMAAGTQPQDPQVRQELVKGLMNDWVQTHGGTNIALSLLIVIMTIAGIAASIAGLVRSDRRKWQAIAGLILCGVCGGCWSLNFLASGFTGATG